MNDKERTLSVSKDELMSLIGPFALSLHMNHPEELSCDLPAERCGAFSAKETEDYLINGSTVRFTSIEARNRCVATYEFEKNRTAFVSDARMWFSTALGLLRYEIDMIDSAAGRLLALVHETDDIFSLAASAIETESVWVFDALQAVEVALPYLNELTADRIFKLCGAQYERTKNDLASGIIFNELEEHFVKQPNTARAIHCRLRSVIVEATANLHPTALLALANSSPSEAVSLAFEDAESPNVLLKSSAIWTLGRLLKLALVPVDQIQLAVAALLASMASSDDRVRQTAIRAATHAAPAMDAFDESLILLGEAGDQYALNAIANTLLKNMREMRSKAKFNDWLRLLCKLSPSSKDAINSFDRILSRLLRNQVQQQFAISCLTDWVSVHAKDAARDKSAAELFNGTTHELSNRPNLLSQMITDWFLSDNQRLASAAAGLLSYCEIRGLKNPEFSKSRLDTLERTDLLFLAKRIAGFILSENHLLSLTMSFLQTDDARQRTFGIVYSLLVNDLGQNYPSSTVEALELAKSATMDTEWRAFYSTIIEAINCRINALDALPHLSELRPPPKLQRQFAKARAKQMRHATEEAQKGSIMRQLVTQIPIKAGIGFFTFRDGGYTDTSHMQSFSHSVALPRRDTLDTVGYEIHRLLLRNVNREES